MMLQYAFVGGYSQGDTILSGYLCLCRHRLGSVVAFVKLDHEMHGAYNTKIR